MTQANAITKDRRATFNQNARKIIKKGAKWIAGLSMTGVAVATLPIALSAIVVNGNADWTTTDIHEFAEQNDINLSATERMNEDSIRVYNRDNPLTYFYQPGLIAAEQIEEFMSSEKERTFEENAQAWQNIAINYYRNLFRELDYGLETLSRDAHAFSRANRNWHEEDPCYILPPGTMNGADLVQEFTGLDAKYITDSDFSESEILTFIMLHELRHCDGRGEVYADLFALDKMEITEERRAEMMTFIKDARILSMLSVRSPHGSDHATAYFLDIAESPEEEGVYIDQAMGYEAFLRHQLYDGGENIAKEDYPFYVYDTLNKKLEAEEFTDNPHLQRIAQLYVDAMERRVANAPHIQNALAQKLEEPANTSNAPARPAV